MQTALHFVLTQADLLHKLQPNTHQARPPNAAKEQQMEMHTRIALLPKQLPQRLQIRSLPPTAGHHAPAMLRRTTADGTPLVQDPHNKHHTCAVAVRSRDCPLKHFQTVQLEMKLDKACLG